MKRGAKKGVSHPGRGGNNVSLHPLTPDQALKGLLSLSPADAKRVRDEARLTERKSGKR